MSGEAAARVLRERAASYARDAEAVFGEDPEAFAILSVISEELRKVATKVEVS